MAEKRTEDASRDRSVNEASGSDHELSSDFVEGPEWKRNDGRNCALSLFIKYRMAQRKKIFKEAKSIPCTQNFLVYWNFYTKNKQGQKVFNDIVKKYGCSVTVSADDEDLYIFDVTCMIFKWESDIFNFVNDVLNSIYKCAKQSLCCDVFSVDHRIQEDTLQRVKEKKELHPAWIEVVGEHDPDAVHVVCAMKDKVSVLIELTEIISKAKKCYNNCEETVAVDFMWQRVLKIFGYLQKFNDKFSNIMIEPDESKDAVMLKGPRDETKAAADHFLKLLQTARSEVHEKLFSPVFKFEILTYPEMCDYIGNFIPKVSILWIPNNLTKKIHIFSKQPEQAKGTEKVIKGCIQEKLYTSSKYHSLFRTGVGSLEKLKQKHKGKIMIQIVDRGLLVTTADDIFETVDAEIQAVISKEIDQRYGRWKRNVRSQDKNAQSTTSGSAGHMAKTVHPTGAPSGNPAASQHSSNSSKISAFQLSENTCLKVYVCSIVEVKNVDAIACEVDTDFSIKRHAVAQMIKKAGGSSYEEEFKQMVSNAKSGSGDVFICKTGGSLKSSNIGHVIHIKCEKLKNHEDMDKLKHLYVQVFQCTKKEKMETIVMPLIGAVSLKEASVDATWECCWIFAKALKEVVESRGKEMNVKEIHLVDINEKLINLISKAFQELSTENTDDIKSKVEKKVEPVSRSKSDEPQDNTPKPLSGVGESWIKVEKGSDNCSYQNCKRKGTKKCAHCGDFLCHICIPENVLIRCPFCLKQSD